MLISRRIIKTVETVSVILPIFHTTINCGANPTRTLLIPQGMSKDKCNLQAACLTRELLADAKNDEVVFPQILEILSTD